MNFDVNIDILWVFLTVASPCLTSPCLNGGTCQEAGNNYTCKCPDGFKGRDCEVELEDGGEGGGDGGLGKTDKRTDCAF